MSRYMETLGMISPTAGGVKRAADIVSALAPPPRFGADAPSTSLTKTPAAVSKSSAGSKMMGFVPGLAGAAVGVLAWKKHRVLGGLLGHAIGSNAMPIYRGGDERTQALYRLGIEGSSIAGALVCQSKQHPILYPVLGYVAGGLLGAVVESFIPGSPVRDRYDQWRAGK